jgi:hypothetical protein
LTHDPPTHHGGHRFCFGWRPLATGGRSGALFFSSPMPRPEESRIVDSWNKMPLYSTTPGSLHFSRPQPSSAHRLQLAGLRAAVGQLRGCRGRGAGGAKAGVWTVRLPATASFGPLPYKTR